MSAPIRIIVVDDHELAHQGLKSILTAFEDRFEVVAEAATVDEALILAEKLKPDVVITDLHFNDPSVEPGELGDGIDLITILKSEQPTVYSILITETYLESALVRAYEAGAAAFLYKHAPSSEMARAIESVAGGFTHFPAQLRSAMEKRQHSPKLTERERQSMAYIARGLTAKQISRELSRTDPQSPIMDRTVEVHKSNIKRKFGLNSASALVAFAIEYCQTNRIDYKNMHSMLKK